MMFTLIQSLRKETAMKKKRKKVPREVEAQRKIANKKEKKRSLRNYLNSLRPLFSRALESG